MTRENNRCTRPLQGPHSHARSEKPKRHHIVSPYAASGDSTRHWVSGSQQRVKYTQALVWEKNEGFFKLLLLLISTSRAKAPLYHGLANKPKSPYLNGSRLGFIASLAVHCRCRKVIDKCSGCWGRGLQPYTLNSKSKKPAKQELHFPEVAREQ